MGGNNSGDQGQKDVFKIIEQKIQNTKFNTIYPKNSKEHNLFDIKISSSNKEYLFEVWSSEYNDLVLKKEFNEKGSVALKNYYFVSQTILKYFKQFKYKPDKFLIININKDGHIFKDDKLNHNYFFSDKKLEFSLIKETFSIIQNGVCYGLFHLNNFKYSIQIKDVELYDFAYLKNIKINHMHEMLGVLVFMDCDFVELIINPFSKINSTNGQHTISFQFWYHYFSILCVHFQAIASIVRTVIESF